MKISTRHLILSATLTAGLALSGPASALQTPAPAKSAAKSAPKAAPTPAPTDAEIAAAKAKGLVWVNTSTKVFHTEGEFYGKTKQGKFMTADEATKAGFRAAKEPAPAKAKKAKSTDSKK